MTISGCLMNQRTGRRIFDEVWIANRFWMRLRGLLFRKSLQPGQALWLMPCHAIHTVGMHYRIDAIFLDRHDRVVKICKDLKPFQTAACPEAHSVLEYADLPLNTLDICLGDSLQFQNISSLFVHQEVLG